MVVESYGVQMKEELVIGKTYKTISGGKITFDPSYGPHGRSKCESPLRRNVAHTGLTFYVKKLWVPGSTTPYYYGDGLWAGRVYDPNRTDSTIHPEDIILEDAYEPIQLSLFD